MTNEDSPDLLNNLNTIMRCIKKRQELHLSLLDYTKRLLLTSKQIDQFSFQVDEQLRNHRLFLNDLQNKHLHIKEEQSKLNVQYQGKKYFEHSQMKLINRSCMRIMEICQASYQKLKQYFDFYQDSHKDFNQSLTPILQGDKINLKVVLDIILRYSYSKFEQDIASLTKIIKLIQEGDRNLISSVLDERIENKLKKQKQLKKKQQQRIQAQIKFKKQKQKVAEKIAQRKQQAKSLEKVKKKKSKFVQKMCTTIYDVLQPSKQHMMEDLNYTKVDDQFNRLYTQIFDRNKIVYLQILHFSAKSEDFKIKVKKFKQLMLSSMKLIKLTPRKKTRTKVQSVISASQLESIQNTSGMYIENRQILNNSQLKLDPQIVSLTQKQIDTPSSNQKFSRKSLQMKIDNTSLKKSQKNYLPQILPQFEKRQRYDSVIVNKGKRFSEPKNKMGQETQQNIQQIFRPQLKVMPVSNIQINMENKLQFRLQQLKRKQPISKAFEYTFYMKKKSQNNKFYEARNNFLI